MSNYTKMLDLVLQTDGARDGSLSSITAFCMISGLFLTPGLLLGSLVTFNRSLFLISVFFAIILSVGIFLQTFIGKREKQQFLKQASSQGISRHEAEEFYENIDWDKVFPEEH